jgi:carotenoid cleavage dioxygenase-like enzyme
MERTKEIRDAANFGNVVVKRYTMFLSGPRAGQWEVKTLTNPKRSTDFPSFNKNYQSKESCVFYALEWFHDEVTYADMAVQKVDICSGEPVKYWYKENYFPSEATFVPRKYSKTEDDGVLLFTAVHGATQQSYLMIVDAKTMQTLEEIAVPGVITFTTHGQFYSSSSLLQ